MSVQRVFPRPTGVSNEQSTSPARPLLEPLEPRVLLSAVPTSEQAIDLVSFDGADVMMPVGLEQTQAQSSGTWYEFPRWTQSNPGGGYNDYFGQSVDIDGEWAIVGWPGSDAGELSVGEAYIYRYSGDTWTPFQSLRPPEVGGGDQFGYSVSLDGTCAVIGAPGDLWGAGDCHNRAGVAFIYEFNGSVWEQVETLRPSSTVGDLVGYAVDVFDGAVIVGAPLHTPPGTVRSGGAFLYKGGGGSWSYAARLVPTGALHSGDRFGSSVSVTNEPYSMDRGHRFLIGAPYDDEAGNDAGAVWQAWKPFMSDVHWFNKVLPWDAGAADHFGEAIEIEYNPSSRILHAIVGAPDSDYAAADAGCVYTFVSPPDDPELGPGLRIAFGDLGPGDRFGSSVSMEPLYSAGGNIARHLVGAPNHWVGQPGAAYIFDDDGTTVTPVAKIWSGGASPPGDADFGQSVALTTTTGGAYDWQALVGSPSFRISGGRAGAASCFRVAQRPVADPDGPYEIWMGDGVTLDGSASYHPDEAFGQSIVSYAWDLDNDGQYDDASVPTPVVPWASIVALGLDYPADPVTGLPNNTIRLRVTDGSGLRGYGSTTLTIYDPAPSISIDDVSMAEGDAGTKVFSFPVRLSHASTEVVTVNYATADGTARTPEDYTAASGTVTFSPGQTERTIPVTVRGDTKYEPHETFTVNLTGPVGATILDGQAVGTIENDDSRPLITIDDVAMPEGDTGTTTFAFTVRLSNPSSHSVRVNYSTSDGTAIASQDYVATNGPLTFSPGQTQQTIPVAVIGETTYEPDESFSVRLLFPVGATILDGQAVGTIENDDPAPSVSISISDVTTVEGDSGTKSVAFTVSLSELSQQTVSVDYATADGTATTPEDYMPVSGTATIAAGKNNRTVWVTVNGDTKFEADETFSMNLSNPVGGTILDGQGVCTIENDDEGTAPTVVDVLVAGEGWEQGYLDFLAAEGIGVGGYSIPVGSEAQLDELPWVNVDQVKVVFSKDVIVSQNNLGVYGADTPQYGFSDFAYDSGSFTATWTLGGPLEADKLLLVLDDAVQDGAGNALDGEWTDEVSTYPSGNGAAGGDFRFRLNALPGDVDQSGEVRSSDTIKVRRKSNTVPGAPDYSVFYDVDGSGEIRASDTIKVRRLSNTELPDGEPTIPPAAPLGGRGGDYDLIAAALRAARRTTDRDLLSPLRADVLSLAEIVPLPI